MRKHDLKYYLQLPYRADLYFDIEDNVWIARFPELPGCVGHGETTLEALRSAEDMKALWLETALDAGDQVPVPSPEPKYSGRLVLRLPKSLHERAAHSAQLEGVSLNTYLIQATTEHVERTGVQNAVRFIGGQISKYLSRFPNAKSYFLGVWLQPVYGNNEDEIGADELTALPIESAPSAQEDL